MPKSHISRLRKELLLEFLPTLKERESALNQFERIKTYVKKKFGVDADLMGSVAKSTFVRGNKDLDVFIFFPPSMSREELEKKGLEIGKSVFEHFGGKYVVDYAEHPYTKGRIEDFDVEIVPCYSLRSASSIKSAVDRTPFHTRWVNSNLTSSQKEDVILLKAFLKAQGIYSSSLKVEGFSGYLCEILIKRFGSFENLVKKALNFQYKEIVDVSNYHKGKLPKALWRKFKDEAFIVIDPVDRNRNVASVLSEENYARFIYCSYLFTKNPSSNFFFPAKKPIDKRSLKKEFAKHGPILVIDFKKPELIDDILYPQLRRALKRIVKELKAHEFELFDTGIFVDEHTVRFVLDFKVYELPKARKHTGPLIYHNKVHIDQFRSKYGRVWVERGRLVTIVDRAFTDPLSFITHFLHRTPENIREEGIPSNIAKYLSRAKVKKLTLPSRISGPWVRYLYNFLCRSEQCLG